jgi:hypothetical protein
MFLRLGINVSIIGSARDEERKRVRCEHDSHLQGRMTKEDLGMRARFFCVTAVLAMLLAAGTPKAVAIGLDDFGLGAVRIGQSHLR